MNVILSKHSLLEAINAACLAADKRPMRPVLSHLHLVAAEHAGLILQATNLEESLDQTVEAEVVKYGSLCVDAFLLQQIVKKLQDAPVTLEQKEGDNLSVRCKRASFSLPTLPSSEFPEFPQHEEQELFTVPVSQLMALFADTAYAIATDETRYYLGGVFLEKQEGQPVRAVSTDGHRLAFAEEDLLPAEDSFVGRIIPRSIVRSLLKVLGDEGGEMTFGFVGGSVVFRYDDSIVTSLLVEGNFPDYQQVLPREEALSFVTLERKELIEALQRVSLVTKNQSYGLKFAIEGSTLLLHSESSGLVGQQKIDLPDRDPGEDPLIGFNAAFFVEALRTLDTKEVLVGISDPQSPLLLKPVVADESSRGTRQHVIMPMRI